MYCLDFLVKINFLCYFLTKLSIVFQIQNELNFCVVNLILNNFPYCYSLASFNCFRSFAHIWTGIYLWKQKCSATWPNILSKFGVSFGLKLSYFTGYYFHPEIFHDLTILLLPSYRFIVPFVSHLSLCFFFITPNLTGQQYGSFRFFHRIFNVPFPWFWRKYA